MMSGLRLKILEVLMGWSEFYFIDKISHAPYSSFISCHFILEFKKAHHILMQDDEYRFINERFGGIFVSGNKNPSMWQQLWRREYV